MPSPVSSARDRVSEVVDRLEEMIISRGLEPGDRLPAERELSLQLKVSRTVVREALGRLQSLGRVLSTHGSGTRVAKPTGQQISAGFEWLLKHDGIRLEDLTAVRIPLETRIAALAARYRTESHLARLEATQARLAHTQATLSERVAADMEFHATLAESTGNPAFQMVLKPIQELLIASREKTIGEFGVDAAYQGHAEILQAVRDHQPVQASAAMKRHLQLNRRHLQSLQPAISEATRNA